MSKETSQDEQVEGSGGIPEQESGKKLFMTHVYNGDLEAAEEIKEKANLPDEIYHSSEVQTRALDYLEGIAEAVIALQHSFPIEEFKENVKKYAEKFKLPQTKIQETIEAGISFQFNHSYDLDRNRQILDNALIVAEAFKISPLRIQEQAKKYGIEK